MPHEFTFYGSNAFVSSHVCDICGLVVTTAKGDAQSVLPREGCFVRSAPPTARDRDTQERQ
jgi:hypothetical protein